MDICIDFYMHICICNGFVIVKMRWTGRIRGNWKGKEGGRRKGRRGGGVRMVHEVISYLEPNMYNL